jgi:hypothetical protein
VYSNAEDPGGNFGENRICTMMGFMVGFLEHHFQTLAYIHK